MSNLLHFHHPREIMSEASLWVVCIEDGLTDDQRRKLEEWLAADPRHAKALTHLANVSSTFDVLSELAHIFPLNQYRPRRTRSWLLKTGAVAAAAAVAGVAALTWYVLPRMSSPAAPDAMQVALPDTPGDETPGAAADRGPSPQRSYETQIGEQLSARLPDGSVVTLNTNTLLEVDYSDAERLATIGRGEASFNVVPDAARPFRVRAGGTMVQAVGTIFNVHYGAADRVEVTVSEGQVRVTSAEPQRAPRPTQDAPRLIDVTVAAGELAVIDGPEEAVRPIDSLEIEAKLAWQQGMLIFRGSPLEEVLADLSRYTTVKFTIADESIRTTRVGGYFRAGDIDGLLVALRESFGIEPRRVGDEIILTARE